MTRGRTLLCFFLLFLFGLSACGKKAPPVPLNVGEPARVGDLAVLAKDGNLFLAWSVPTTQADGSRLQDLIGFRVFRRETPYPFSPCVSCPERFEPVAEIDVDYPRGGARVEGGRVLWEDAKVKAEHEYTYYVVAYNSAGVASAESSAVRKLWASPPEAPHGLEVQVLDRALRLNWKFEKRFVDGNPIREGPYLLKPGDLRNPPLFSLKLWGLKDSLTRFLWEKLSPETRRLVEEYDFSKMSDPSFRPVAERLIRDLNEALKDPSFDEEGPWAGIPLSPRVMQLMAKKPTGEDRIRLNRLLLEEAFPRDIEGLRIQMAGFHLYRRGQGERFGFLPLNPEPLQENEFLDGNLANGKKYIYSVRAVRNFHGSFIEGPGSGEESGIPEKKTPPLPPTGLLAGRVSQGVELRWNRSPEPDIAGYDVYRRAEGEESFTRINPRPVTEPYFLDPTADPRKAYHYRLKAVDSSPGKMESEFSMELESRPES